MENDRLDMIKHISFENDDDMSFFRDYIPDHYDEIYSLFSLLKDAAVDYHEIRFKKPKEKDDAFIFLFSLKKKFIKLIASHLKENDNIISYMRNKSFNVVLNENDNSVSLKFKKC